MTDLKPLVQYDFKSIDKSSGTNMLNDKSGNSFNGTVHSGCSIQNDSVMGNCMYFDGTSKGMVTWVGTSDASIGDFTKGYTMTAWVNFAAWGNQMTIVDLAKSDSGTLNLILQLTHDNNGTFQLSRMGGSYPPHFQTPQPTPSSKPGVDILALDQWAHVAITFDSFGNGALYLNGIELAETSTANTAYLPSQSETVMSNLAIGNLHWPAGGVDSFKGKMAWLSIYDKGLTSTEINQDMVQGEGNRTVSFRRSFPVEFEVYSINNNDHVQAIYIDNTGVSQDLYLEVTNNTANTIAVPAERDIFSLSFRPGTLSSSFLQASSDISVTCASSASTTTSSWSVSVAKDTSGVEKISFKPPSSVTSIANGENLTFTLKGASANRVGGTRNTNVEFSYNLGTKYNGQLLQSLSIINHLGQKDIPLHVDIIGAPTVLNDGETHNELVFRIENVGKKPISLSKSFSNGISAFNISLLTEGEDLEEWALVKTTDVSSLSFQWPLVGLVNANTSSTEPKEIELRYGLASDISQGTTLNITPPTGAIVTATLAEAATAGETKLKFENDQALEKGSVVSLASGLGVVVTGDATSESTSVTLKEGLNQSIPNGTIVIFTAPNGTEKQATLASDAASNATTLTLKNKHSIAAASGVTLATPEPNWQILQQNQISGQLGWTVTNQSGLPLDPGDSFEFIVKGIVCSLPSGQSAITVSYHNIPGYWDGQFIIPVTKSPIVSSAQHVGIATPPVEEAYLNLPYPSGGSNGKLKNGIIIGDATHCKDNYGGLAVSVPLATAGQADPFVVIQQSKDASTGDIKSKQSFRISPNGNLFCGSSNTGTSGGGASGNIYCEGVTATSIDAGSGEIQTTGEVSAGSVLIDGGNMTFTSTIFENASLYVPYPTGVGKKGISSGIFIGDTSCASENYGALAIATNGTGPNPFVVIGAGSGGSGSTLLASIDSTGLITTTGVNAGSGTIQTTGSLSGGSLTCAGANVTGNSTLGSVGIGGSPSYPLHVKAVGGITVQAGTKAYDGIADSFKNKQGCSVSIVSKHSVTGSRFVIYSDQRLKHRQEHSDALTDLNTLLQLRTTDFQFKDKSNSGDAVIKGLIAQELETIMPDAVIQLSEFIPDVYSMAKHIEHDEEKKELTIHLEEEHALQVGDVLELHSDEDRSDNPVVAVPDPKKVVVGDWHKPTKELFVFGKQVHDLRGVDYNQITMLGVSATQQLHRELEATKKELQELKAQHEREISDLKAELTVIKELIKNL